METVPVTLGAHGGSSAELVRAKAGLLEREAIPFALARDGMFSIGPFQLEMVLRTASAEPVAAAATTATAAAAAAACHRTGTAGAAAVSTAVQNVIPHKLLRALCVVTLDEVPAAASGALIMDCYCRRRRPVERFSSFFLF